MTRGNQRDLAREKARKKLAEQNKAIRSDNLTVEQRKQRDADLMREKQLKKKGDQGAVSSSSPSSASASASVSASSSSSRSK